MSPVLKNVLAVVVGVVVGMAVNMGLIMVSGSVIPPPAGVDPTDMESLKANMHLFEARHFIFPFLAHALGTLAGAFAAVKLAASQHMKIALGIGAFFPAGRYCKCDDVTGSYLVCSFGYCRCLFTNGLVGLEN